MLKKTTLLFTILLSFILGSTNAYANCDTPEEINAYLSDAYSSYLEYKFFSNFFKKRDSTANVCSVINETTSENIQDMSGILNYVKSKYKTDDPNCNCYKIESLESIKIFDSINIINEALLNEKLKSLCKKNATGNGSEFKQFILEDIKSFNETSEIKKFLNNAEKIYFNVRFVDLNMSLKVLSCFNKTAAKVCGFDENKDIDKLISTFSKETTAPEDYCNEENIKERICNRAEFYIGKQSLLDNNGSGSVSVSRFIGSNQYHFYRTKAEGNAINELENFGKILSSQSRCHSSQNITLDQFENLQANAKKMGMNLASNPEPEFKHFPNPAIEYLNLEFNDKIYNQCEVSFAIFDMQGKLYQTYEKLPLLQGTPTKLTLPETLNSGMYILKMNEIRCDNRPIKPKSSFKFIKHKF